MRSRHDSSRGGNASPFVSIIIPVYNDPEGIVTTLGTLVAQTYPTDHHEIIVVDNGSTDDTPDIVSDFATAHSHIRLVVEPAGGSYTARNAGIRAADGSLLSFIDADMWVTPDWLETVVSRVTETDAAYLACNVELGAPSGRHSVAERYNRHTAFPIREYVEDWEFAPTCCLTIQHDVIEVVGGFDDRLVSSGDREFGNRVAAAGYDLVFAEDISMIHPARTSVASLYNKAVRIGRGKYQIRKYYPERYGRPIIQLVNPLNYTPPLPRSMRNHVRDWDGLPMYRQALFTLLAWVLTLAKAVGAWWEALESEDESQAVTSTSDVTTHGHS